jgi:hypothetical protein
MAEKFQEHTDEYIKEYIKEYISEFTEQERIVYNIAKEHLESSFDIEKSIGFLEWLEKRQLKQKEK